MLLQADETLLKKKGITPDKIDEQLKAFINGFPFLEIRSAAEVGKGILQVNINEIPQILQHWDEYLQTDATIIKFVPASGAASRMFKDLFEFLESKNNFPESSFEKKFFNDIKKFAFYEKLNETCTKNTGKSIDELIVNKQFKPIVENLLSEKPILSQLCRSWSFVIPKPLSAILIISDLPEQRISTSTL